MNTHSRSGFSIFRRGALVGGLAAIVAAGTPLLAHHGYSAYDMTKTETLKGTITNFALQNPHAQIGFDVKSTGGEMEHWVVEAGTARGMRDSGFDRDTLKAGDAVTVTFHPSLNGAHIGVLNVIQLPDGRKLPERKAGQRSGADATP